ncbi:MAG: helix-turn-helix transcriptional regulator [Ruminococcaceae bacterium]|nr:helix-turn-helix transcriptional regulator [Oscillospiraceae bacterium]
MYKDKCERGIKVYFKDFFMKDEIEYNYYLSEKGEMPFSHVHTKFEMYFCAEKTPQRSVINGNEYFYDFPCVIISSPYTIHSMSSVNTSRYERMVVYFGERTLSAFGDRIAHTELLRRSPGYLFELNEAQGRELKELIYPLMKPEREFSEVEKELGFMLFLNKLLEICPEERVTEVGRSALYIQGVLKYLTENFNKDITTDEVAQRFAVSRSKLDRDFKRCTDSTAHDFLEGCRLNNAKNMLLDREKYGSVSEVASLCGFRSDTYFYSFFKRHTGMSPHEYRMSAAKNKK